MILLVYILGARLWWDVVGCGVLWCGSAACFHEESQELPKYSNWLEVSSLVGQTTIQMP